MIDNPYFKVVDAPVFEPNEDVNEILSGNYWGIKKTNGEYVLNFISGAHDGKSIDIVISEIEFKNLKLGKIDIDAVLKAHNTG